MLGKRATAWPGPAILGISAFYHDSAAALVVGGEIVAAAQEERFTRRKHDHAFPINAIRYCLDEAGIAPEALDYVGFYDKPFLKLERLLETYLSYAPRGFSDPFSGSCRCGRSRSSTCRARSRAGWAATADRSSSRSTTSRTRPVRSFRRLSTRRPF